MDRQPVSGPAPVERSADLPGCKIFGKDEGVDPFGTEKAGHSGVYILPGVDSRHSGFRSQFSRYLTRDEIDGLGGGDCDEKIAGVNAVAEEVGGGYSLPDAREEIVDRVYFGELGAVASHKDYILVFR